MTKEAPAWHFQDCQEACSCVACSAVPGQACGPAKLDTPGALARRNAVVGSARPGQVFAPTTAPRASGPSVAALLVAWMCHALRMVTLSDVQAVADQAAPNAFDRAQGRV